MSARHKWGWLGRLAGLIVLLSGGVHASPMSTTGQFDVSSTGATCGLSPIPVPAGTAR